MKAAILEKIGAPLTVADIDLPEKLERGQVLVKVVCTGICGSQLQEIDGIKGDPAHLPHLLGHEGCGIVEDFGEGVTTVKKGDKVVMHWRKGAGIEAQPAIYQRRPYQDDGTLIAVDISQEVKAGPITTFSEYAVVSENRVTAIPQDVPNDLAALLGCALSTALSVIENEARPMASDLVLVIGCGGLGLSLIFATSLLSDSKIWATDRMRNKQWLAMRFGATFGMIIGSGFADVVIDTVGETNANKYVKNGGKLISLQANGTSGGGFNPPVDIPRYLNMDLAESETLITHRILLDQINDGIQLMRDGKAGRVMIEMQ